MEEIKIFSPATIANISCGFDVLGCCLDSIGDEMVVRKTSVEGINISKIIGEELPLDINKNVAGIAAQAFLKKFKKDINFGFEIEIYKNIKPGSGIGSSAASAAGVVFAMNELLNKPFSKIELIEFAQQGEKLACGSPIADNVAPVILGGFTLVKSTTPLKVLELPSLDQLYATIIHPQVEIKTSDSRAILPSKVRLEDAVKQWANVGSLVHALHTNDYPLFSNSLKDFIIEPYRATLIPNFNNIVSEAMNAGALGGGISGSGPSIFIFSKGKQVADNVANKLKLLLDNDEITYRIYISKINTKGIKIINKNSIK